LSEITPLEKKFSKPSMKELLAKLRDYVDVSEEFESKRLHLIDRRYILVHRWTIEYGLPCDDASYQKLAAFSARLANDAIGLSNILHKYIVQWIKKFLQFQGRLAENESVWLSRIPDKLQELK
jgi:hypothetical protein